MIELPYKFLERMRRDLGEGYGAFVSSYARQPFRAIRVNTLKISAEEFAEISPFALTPVPWEENGFYIDGDKAGKTILHAAGLYYVQEPSAMSAAPLLQVKAGERVLDMCSAPGGKGTQLAQRMRGEGIIVLNEINGARAKILLQNVERLGITNAAVISESPQRIGEYFEGYFDKVLVDAPCSGEGMFLKEESAVREWSTEAVSACARRQALILDSAQRALKPDGLLVYSTCTFAPEEDEEQVENFLKKYPHFELIHMKKLLPNEVRGEGHFVALLKKTDGEERDVPRFKCKTDKKTVQNWAAEFGGGENLHIAEGTLYKIMPDCPALPFKILRVGLKLGDVKEYGFEPAHALAMSYRRGETPCFDMDGAEALSYLRGNVISRETDMSGWVVASFNGYPLGWCKISGGTAKNHLPRGLRI